MKLFNIQIRKFDFEKFIYFHGWIYLAPYNIYENERAIGRYLKNSTCKNVYVKIIVSDDERYTILKVIAPEDIKTSDRDKTVLRKQIKRMFMLDEDFSAFHDLCKKNPSLKYVYENNCKGMLRSPNAFEDLTKTVCTTNCDWRNTKKMCTSLCGLDSGNFPSPKDILKYSIGKLSKIAPLGYRANTVYQISKLTEEGKLELDRWADDGDYGRIRKVLKDIKGIGEYSINHMLVLLGDFSNIPVDSEVLKYLKEIYFRGKDVSTKELTKPFERYGDFKYLAYKYERMARKLNYINK